MSELTLPSNRIVVLKLSGGIFFSKGFDSVVSAIKKAARLRKNTRFVIVAGGGRIARDYIDVAKSLGADQTSQDELGIKGSQLNATVFALALGKITCDSVPTTLNELVETFDITSRKSQVVVCGGLQPGQSTNAAAALVAEKLCANLFLNSTDIDGVYTRDPRKYKDATRLATVTAKELTEILETESMDAGAYDLMDPIALKLIQRSKIQTWIIKCDGSTIEDFLVRNRKIGTRIVFEK
jgi:uridylate kinase